MAIQTSTIQLLIISDDPARVANFDTVLESMSYELHHAESSKDALETYLLQSPQAVLVDSKLQSHSPQDVIVQLRELPAEDIPILAFCPSDDDLIDLAWTLDCDDVLTLPLSSATLKHRLARVLDQPSPISKTDNHLWYKHLFEEHQRMKLLIDPETQGILDANATACEFYGYSLTEIKQKRIGDLAVHAQDFIDQNVSRIMDETTSVFQFQHRHASGDIRDVEVYGHPVTIDGQNLLYVLIQDITAYQRAVKHLKHRDTLLSNISDSVISTDTDFIITSWNSAAQSLYGWTDEEAIGQSIIHLVPTRYENDMKWQDMNAILLKEGAWRGNVRQAHKNGSWIDVLLSASIMLNDDGEMIGYLGIAEDVTERKGAEDSLRQSEARFRQIYEHAPVMIHSFDSDANVVSVNAQWLRETGYEGERIIGKPYSDVMTADSAEQFQTIILPRLWQDGDLQHIPLQYRRADGGVMDIMLNMTVTQEPQSDATRVLCISHDVSIQSQVEQSLTSAYREMRSIFTSMTDNVFVLNRDGRYLKIAPTKSELRYLPRSEVLGKSFHDIFPKKLADRFLQHVNTVLETQQATRVDYEFELDGEIRWTNAIVNPIPKTDMVVWVSRDITPQKQIEEALRNSEKQYRELFEHGNDAILVVSTQDGAILDANQSASKLLGYTTDELKVHKISDIEIQNAASTNQMVLRLQGQGRMLLELSYRHQDGRRIPVEVTSQVIQYQGQEAILSFARDIQQRKAAQQAERNQRKLAEALRDTATALNQSLDLDTVLDLILSHVNQVVPSDTADVMFIESNNTARIHRSRGYKDQHGKPTNRTGNTLDLSTTYNLRWVIEHKRSYIIPDVTELDDQWSPVGGSDWIQSNLASPILLDDEVIGFITLNSAELDRFTQQDSEQLNIFAEQASLAIRNARLFAQVQSQADNLQSEINQQTSVLRQANSALTEQIQKRQQAETELEAERNVLRTIIDSLPDIVFVKNLDGEFILTNRQARTYHSADIADQPAFDFIKRELTETLLDEELALLQNGETLIREESYTDSNAQEQWIRVTKSPLKDAENNITGLIGVVHDLTDIKQAQAQLQQLLASAHCLLWYAIVTEKLNGEFAWNIHVANEESAQTFLPMAGRKEDYTTQWQKSILEEDRQQFNEIFRQHIHDGQYFYHQEYRCELPTGEIRWLNEDVQVRQLTPGRYSLLGVATDITDSKIAQNSLLATNEDLEKRVLTRTTELSKANTRLLREIEERQRAEEAEREQRLFAETLQSTATALNQTLNQDAVFDVILELVLKVVPSDTINIMLIEGADAVVYRNWGYEKFLPENMNPQGARIPIKDAHPLNTMMKTTAPYRIGDVTKADGQWVTTEYSKWTKSFLGVPLILGQTVIGFINLDSQRVNHFDEQDATNLQVFAAQAAVAIQNAQYVNQIESEIADRRRAEIAERDQRILAEALRDTSEAINQTLDLENVMRQILAQVARVMPPHQTVNLMLLNPADDSQVWRRYARENRDGEWVVTDSDEVFRVESIPNLQRMQMWGKPLTIPDTSKDDRWINRKKSNWIQSYVGTPILSGGETIGFINMGSEIPNVFNERHADRLRAFANQAGIAIHNARLVADLGARVVDQTQATEFERAKLDAILNAMNDGVIYRDADDNVVYINKALVELTGYTEGEWKDGSADSRIVTMNSEELEQLNQRIEKTLKKRGVFRHDYPLIRKDGTEFIANLTRTEVKEFDGTRLGVVIVVRDISHEKRLESQKSRFIANASHELRTPIANVKTRLYLMRRKPEKLNEYLDVAESVVNWMHRMVENLFDYSRFERGVIQLDYKLLFLQDILNEVLLHQEVVMRQKNITLKREIVPTPIPMRADPLRLRQVLDNLMNNATRYTVEGGKIALRTFLDDGDIVIQVADTGTGIPEENLDDLFQPFFRTEDSSGAGLGLSIVKEIVERHGGNITVASEVGVGTTFTMTFPLLPSATEDDDL